MVRCDTPPQAAAWKEHHAVPTVARDSSTRATGSKSVWTRTALAGGVRSFSGATLFMRLPTGRRPRRGRKGRHRGRARPGSRSDRVSRPGWRRRAVRGGDNDVRIIPVPAVIPWIVDAGAVIGTGTDGTTAAAGTFATGSGNQH